MKCATSFFSSGIFRKNLKRFWPVWAVYLLVWLLVLPLPMINDLRVIETNSAGILRRVGYIVLSNAKNEGLIITGVGAICAAMAVWGWMYNPRSSAMHGSLPARRGTLYISGLLSALVPMLAAHVLTFLATAVVELVMGCFYPGYLLQWLAISVMELLLFFGIATFCAMLTGNIVVLPILYVVLNFTSIVVSIVIAEILDVFIYGYAGMSFSFIALSPFARILTIQIPSQPLQAMSNAVPAYYFPNWELMIVYCAVGLVLLAAASLLLRRRRLESAGDVVAVRALRPVFKYVFTGGCSIVLGMLFYSVFWGDSLTAKGTSSAVCLTIMMLIGALIGYFSAAMLLKKSFRVFNQWRGFAVCALVICAFCAACEFDVFNYERYMPTVSEINMVGISARHGFVNVREPETIAMAMDIHRGILENKQEYEDGNTDSTTMMEVFYTLRDGGVCLRRYSIPINRYMPIELQNETLQRFQALCNTPEVILERNTPDVQVIERNIVYGTVTWATWQTTDFSHKLQLTDTQTVELWEQGILPDLTAGTIGTISLIGENTRATSCEIYIELYDSFAQPKAAAAQTSDRIGATPVPTAQATSHECISLTVTLDAQNTLQWLAEHGVEPITRSALEKLQASEGNESDLK